MRVDSSRGPSLAVDAVVEYRREIVLIERKNPPHGWALPGGFVEEGETVEQAVGRELREETGLEALRVRQWKVFSRPDRDPRGHVISVCFRVWGQGSLRASTDASRVETVSPIPPWPTLAFDHERILEEYRHERFRG